MDALLTAENFSLRQQLETLLHEARCNEVKMARFDQLERQLIAADTLVDLIRLLLNDYRQAFAIEKVSLALVDREYEIRRVIDEAQHKASTEEDFSGLQLLPDSQLLHPLFSATPATTRLCAYSESTHGVLFPEGQHAIATLALLPLYRQNTLIGSLHLGSADTQRYCHGVGTAFLDRLASIIAICLETTLARERLKQAGLTDPLTGVQNRRYFEHRCPAEVSQARRHHQSLACMFLDIDKFKRINDNHGHPTGDAVLRGVAQVIQAQLRSSDTIARFGGEEFVVLLPQTPGHHAQEIAERIRLAVSCAHFENSQGQAVPVTLSIGLSQLSSEPPGDTAALASALVSEADQALYRAKHNGRNQVVCAFVPQARRQLVPWALSSRMIPAAFRLSRIRSASAKFLASLAALRCAIKSAMLASSRPPADLPPLR